MADFATEYGLHLMGVNRDLPWREFEVYLTGLLAADTRLYRHFAPEREAD